MQTVRQAADNKSVEGHNWCEKLQTESVTKCVSVTPPACRRVGLPVKDVLLLRSNLSRALFPHSTLLLLGNRGNGRT